jgi:hypothetical protein
MEYPGLDPGPKTGIHRNRLNKRSVRAYDGAGGHRHEFVV